MDIICSCCYVRNPHCIKSVSDYSCFYKPDPNMKELETQHCLIKIIFIVYIYIVLVLVVNVFNCSLKDSAD